MENSFPANMSILVVDANPLTNLEIILHECQYHVTTTGKACTTLDLLDKNKNMFDLVITEIHLPDMDGFTFLKLIGQKLSAPVIILSSCDDKEVVKKCIIHGACEYLLKPSRMEELKNIWQHVYRRKMFNPIGEPQKQPKIKTKYEDTDENKAHEEEHKMFGVDQQNKRKRPRLVWTDDLHKKFLQALELLGHDNIVPKKILELMIEENLTRENVASHLQKYRLYLANKKRERKVSQNHRIPYPLDPRVVQKNLMNSANEEEFSFYSSMEKEYRPTRHQMQLNFAPPSGSPFPVAYNHSFATQYMFEGNQLPNYHSSQDHPYPIPVDSNGILCQEISNGSFGPAGNVIESRLPFANVGNFDFLASYFNNANDLQWNE